MPTSNRVMIHKLQHAINGTGEKLLVDKSQFYSEGQQRPVTVYKISRGILQDNGKTKKEKLFETASQIQIVLFLRDYWYALTGKPIPTNNETWNEIKEKQGLDFADMENLGQK